ncbi:Hydroxymethylpyrimidine/phosphomethylpyrimidine kinase [Aquimixticola soesokkakensis]|uniref:hydroxymethylpyrimidine kinase n=1 Tax=Aquimixticola soesokkakensis TaxID=1519096 RepID=A0A1Y5TN54_9RHOB|nr:hydroxymethylpyrimidine/phosphomethylpyrimidine kinase [Aquimixticola soesokkakensis]SLN64140.1 Hydroxymethylpyrimidine/phosphomethylpyrimidine kinase [Aquimixticola soesokkakensis]
MTRLLIIGGTDSSGGAGLTRDAWVAQAHGIAVAPVVSVVTAQTNSRLHAAWPMPADSVGQQIAAALACGPVGAVKIGALGTHDNAAAVHEALAGQGAAVVFDPVLKTSSGGGLLSGPPPWPLLARAALVTPNLQEAAMLAQRPLPQTPAQVVSVAEVILSKGARAVLIKGGHGTGPMSCDMLKTATQQHVFQSPRLRAELRGTGCALATAIACNLAQGRDLKAAIGAAKAFVHACLQAGTYLEAEAIRP